MRAWVIIVYTNVLHFCTRKIKINNKIARDLTKICHIPIMQIRGIDYSGMATVGAASRLLAELEILENCTAKDLEDVEFEVTAKTKSGGELTVTVLKIHRWSELNMGVCKAHIRGLNLCTCIYLQFGVADRRPFYRRSRKGRLRQTSRCTSIGYRGRQVQGTLVVDTAVYTGTTECVLNCVVLKVDRQIAFQFSATHHGLVFLLA